MSYLKIQLNFIFLPLVETRFNYNSLALWEGMINVVKSKLWDYVVISIIGLISLGYSLVSLWGGICKKEYIKRKK